MYELALFAGVGGGVLGGKILGWRTVGAVEFNPYCREVLLRRQRDGVLPLFPIWEDVRSFRIDNPETGPYCESLRGVADRLVVTAGFPCQPFSSAGKQAGEDDSRNMWPDTARILRELGPRVALLENVGGLLSFDYFGEVIGDLAEAGYDAEWAVVSAGDCGAPHRRDRLWIVAYRPADAVRVRARGGALSEGVHQEEHRVGEASGDAGAHGEVGAVADADCERWNNVHELDCRKEKIGRSSSHVMPFGAKFGNAFDNQSRKIGKNIRGVRPGWWSRDPSEVAADPDGLRFLGGVIGVGVREPDDAGPAGGAQPGMGGGPAGGAEPRLGRVADGVADRVDRLRSIGNGQVSVVAAVAFCNLAQSAGLDLREFAPALFNEEE